MSEDAHWEEDMVRHEMLLQHHQKAKERRELLDGAKQPIQVTPKVFWVALKEFASDNAIDTIILKEPPNDFLKSKYHFIKVQEIIE